MATSKKNFFDQTVKSFLPNEILYQMAKETRFMQRQGKIKMNDFFWNQVLGFDSGITRSINQFRKNQAIVHILLHTLGLIKTGFDKFSNRPIDFFSFKVAPSLQENEMVLVAKSHI
ncbi:MAG: hypothetical protein K8T10_09610 [Candidatus Eremiobacteraeota bacterium]|nr:hypothetical protein [Candidatus Eremiobacteraeota bacterium]